ncbi:MAG: helix-turn-helix transcriptional regulator [Clostridia bacterium]|nr:helix-turn-helix transcriptional regulator [Clostridia bacterium]
MTIGNRIVSLRKERQFSQEEIADKIGVSRQSVSKWETDACAPDAYNLIALANVLNTSVEYIVTGERGAESKPQTNKESVKVKDLAILGFILLVGGFIMAFLGMFLHEIWCIIGAYIATTGIIFALVRKKKTFCIVFSIMAVLIIVTVLLLTL